MNEVNGLIPGHVVVGVIILTAMVVSVSIYYVKLFIKRRKNK